MVRRQGPEGHLGGLFGCCVAAPIYIGDTESIHFTFVDFENVCPSDYELSMKKYLPVQVLKSAAPRLSSPGW